MNSNNSNYDKNQENTFFESLVTYILIINKYRWLIICITSVAIIFSVIFSIVSIILPPEKSPLPNRYKASVTVFIAGEDSMSSFISTLGLSQLGLFDSQAGGFDYSQIAILALESRSFLDVLIEEFNITQKYNIQRNTKTSSRGAMLKRSEFNFDSVTGAFTISFEDIDPIFARDMVNRMLELLREWFSDWGGISKIRQQNLLEDKIAEISSEISRLESLVLDFQEKYGVLTFEELARSQSNILADLRSQLILKDIEIKKYSQLSRIEDPILIRLKSEYDSLLSLIEQIEQGTSSESGRSTPGLRDLPELALQFSHLTLDLEIQRRIYQSLFEQYETSKLTNALENEPISLILEEAEIPDRKSGPLRVVFCLVTSIVTFVFGNIIVLVINAVNKMAKDTKTDTVFKGKV